MSCPYCGHAHKRDQLCPTGAKRIDVLSFEGLSVAEDKSDKRQRILQGIALPYGEELQRMDWLTGATRWIFDPKSVELSDNPIAFYGHDHLNLGLPIGRVLADESEHREAGFFLRMLLSKTPKAEEVYTLAEDGVLTRFSVGLDRPNATTVVEDAESRDPLLRWQKAPVWETSVVPRPAYDSAKIDAVLHMETRQRESITMKCQKCGVVHAAGVTDCDPALLAQRAILNDAGLGDLQTQVESLTSSLQVMERQLVTLGTAAGDGSPRIDVPGRSYGEFIKLAAQEDESALAFLTFIEEVAAGKHGADQYLAMTGTTIADIDADWITSTWVLDLTRRLVERRKVLNLFQTRPLPGTGMTVEYGRVGVNDDDIEVAEQLLEGDLLAYGKIAFEGGLSTPVRTFGGWSDMSLQVIQRSGVAVVEALFNALINRYLQVTEAATRVLAVDPANSTAIPGVNPLADADDWVNFIVDAAFMLDDEGLPLDFLLVSRQRFKALATMRTGPADDAPYLLDRDTGSINVTGLSGRMFNLPIQPLNVAGDYVRAGSEEAITTFEAPGAPFRLQDDDITHLTKAFSIYGYAAFASTNKKALVRPTLA